MTYQHDDGSLILAQWAEHTGQDADRSTVQVRLGPGPQPMYGTEATGRTLVGNGFLGVDLISVPPGKGFAPHTHPGDHLLIVVGGYGTITVEGTIYPTEAGQVYMVEGAVPHAVSARPDSPHVILAVGAPHRDISAADRAALTEYSAVAADLGRMRCLVCPGSPTGTAAELAATGCRHAPADAGLRKPLLVGLAPRPELADSPPFLATVGGERLEQYLRLGPGRLLDALDTINLSPEPIADWSRVSTVTWQEFAVHRILPNIGGRVVLLAGETVTAAVARAEVPVHRCAVIGHDLINHTPTPWLAVHIPHPRAMSKELAASAATQATLEIAVQMARTGPAYPDKGWSQGDVEAINEAIARTTGEYLRNA